jgi:hypothetical protein
MALSFCSLREETFAWLTRKSIKSWVSVRTELTLFTEVTHQSLPFLTHQADLCRRSLPEVTKGCLSIGLYVWLQAGDADRVVTACSSHG